MPRNRKNLTENVMNLIIDIGNTRAKIAVFGTDEEPVELIYTDHKLTDLSNLAKRHACQRGIISTTAGLTQEAEQKINALHIPMLRLTGDTPTPIHLHYHTPKTLGTDRLAAVVGAWSTSPGKDVLVIDCGTCVTYDILDGEGNYWGGNISPGLGMRLRALHQQTARLPLVCEEGEIPEIGYDTETAIRSGVIQGLKREIEGYILHFQGKYPQLSVFLTGGDAQKLGISKESCIFAAEFLVLRGLNTILDYNK